MTGSTMMNHYDMLMGPKDDVQRNSFLKATIAVMLAFVLALSPGLAFATAGDSETTNAETVETLARDEAANDVSSVDVDDQLADEGVFFGCYGRTV